MFKENFIKICNIRGLAPTRVMQDIGLTHSAFTKWTDESVPRKATLMKLAERLDCTIDDLLNDVALKATKNGTRPIIGIASAGKGVFAEEDIIGYEKVDAEFDTDEYYWIRVVGSSMSPKIEDGDLVLIQTTDSVDNGNLAVVIVDGTEGFLKRIDIGADVLSLVSINPLYKPIIFQRDEIGRVKICGKAVQLKRML